MKISKPGIDRAMRATLEDIRDRFSADHPRYVLFTTFNFASQFFESNVLPLLVGDTVDDLKGASETRYAINADLETLRCLVVCDRSTCPEPKGDMRYGLLPVGLADGRFHPKLMLMFGTLKDTQQPGLWMSVGSGNLTLSGWGVNREVVGMTPVTSRHASELNLLFEWLRGQAALQFGSTSEDKEEGGVREILRVLHEAVLRDDNLVPHTRATPSLHVSLPQKSGSESMLDALKGDVAWHAATVVSPYWSAVDQLVEALGVKTCRFVPSLTADGKYRFPVDTVNLTDRTFAAFEKDSERYTHAKALLLENGQERVLCIGSANFTQAAMLSAGNQTLTNIEAMLRYELGAAPDPWKAQLRLLPDPSFASVDEDDEEDGAPPLPPFDATVLYDWTAGEFRAHLTVTGSEPVRDLVLSIGAYSWTIATAAAGETCVMQPWVYKGAQPVRSFSVHYRLAQDEPAMFRGLITQLNAGDDQLGYLPRPRLNRVLELLRSLNPLATTGKTRERVLSELADGTGDGEEESADPTFDFFGLFQATWKLQEYYQTKAAAERDPYDKLAPYGAVTLYRAITGQAAITHEEKIGRYIQLSEMRDVVARLDKTTKFKSTETFRSDIETEISVLGAEMTQLLGESQSFRSMFGEATPERIEAFLSWFHEELQREVSHQAGGNHGR
ncbi:hypothetical protein C2L64_46380 [Paraburkholderia hospita]|uniref:PLD phosphodiesterase domain-containing protein n=2 Tax=Paraburkholderia hospita TaxID=169430 RepID=A0AAN1MQG5_9BURK|nr:hypothetical protein C2L64_46380 [Paraburkholderia hospita]